MVYELIFLEMLRYIKLCKPSHKAGLKCSQKWPSFTEVLVLFGLICANVCFCSNCIKGLDIFVYSCFNSMLVGDDMFNK